MNASARLAGALAAMLVQLASPSAAAPAASAAASAAIDPAARAAADRVLAGRSRMHARFDACADVYRKSGHDVRLDLALRDLALSDVFEGARLATVGAPAAPQSPSRSRAVPDAAECAALAAADPQALDGVADADLRRMRDAYAASKPDPHVARDWRLRSDCMKSNDDNGLHDYDVSVQRCDCVMLAMDEVPADQLDAWATRARGGAKEPMQDQPWWHELWPKIEICYGG